MESFPKLGCIIRSENDPYQFQCVFSTDPEDKPDFSVYFHSPGGKQEIMASCTYNEGYDCAFAREGLSLTEDFYISVSETFSKQNGSFVCRNGGALFEKFPCFYSGNNVKSEVKYGMTDVGSTTLHNPGDFGTEDSNLAVIIGAVFGFLIILQFIFIGFLLFKNRKLRKDRKELRLSTEKSEEAKKEAKSNLIERKSEEAKKEEEKRSLIESNSEAERLHGKMLSFLESETTESSISIASEGVAGVENEASDTIETQTELRDSKVSPADTYQSEKASLPGK